MDWTQRTAEKAFELYVTLTKRGFITHQEEYFAWFGEREVQDFIRKVIEPKGKVMVFMDTEARLIQMVPEIENEVSSYTNEDLRKELGFKDNNDVHLFYFILFILIAELEQPHDADLVARMYLPKDELLAKLNDYIQQYETLGEDFLEKMSEEFDVDIVGIVKAWTRMAEYKEGAKRHSATKDNHRVYVDKTLAFLEKEKLIRIREKVNVEVTEKMRNIISNYYHNVTNKSKIHDLLHQTKDGFDFEGEE